STHPTPLPPGLEREKTRDLRSAGGRGSGRGVGGEENRGRGEGIMKGNEDTVVDLAALFWTLGDGGAVRRAVILGRLRVAVRLVVLAISLHDCCCCCCPVH